MNSGPARAAESNICIAAVVIIYAAYALHLFFSSGQLDDDRLYLFSTSYFLSDWLTWRQVAGSLFDHLSSGLYSEEVIARFQFRHEYTDNYLLHASAISLVRTLFPLDSSGLEYGAWLFAVLQGGLGLGHLLCLGIVLAALWHVRQGHGPQIVLLAMTLLLLASFLPDAPIYRLTAVPSEFGSVVGTLWFLADPSPQFDIFGSTPRGAATLLAVAVVLLRWAGRYALAYWIIAFVLLVHGTYAVLILAIFCAMDLVLRPAVLRRWGCFLPAGLVAAAAVFRSGPFGSFGGSEVIVAGVFLFVALAACAASPAGERVSARIPGIAALRTMPRDRAEAILVALGMVVILLMSSILASATTGLTTDYIAHELSGRPLAILRVLFLLVAISALLDFTRTPDVRVLARIAVVACGLAYAIGYRSAFPISEALIQADQSISAFERNVTRPAVPLAEEQLYFVLVCQMDEQCAARGGAGLPAVLR